MTHLYFVAFDATDLCDDISNFDGFVEANDVDQAIRLWCEANREALDELRGEGGILIAPDNVFLVPTLTGIESLRPWNTVGHAENLLYPHMNQETESQTP